MLYSYVTAICMNLDNTFKAANKATVVDSAKNHMKLMKGGILSVINEINLIISWVNFGLYCWLAS